MKLRALITIDVEAVDFVEAADHQRRIQELMEALQASYPAADLTFRERRSSRRGATTTATDQQTLPRSSGRLRNYVS